MRKLTIATMAAILVLMSIGCEDESDTQDLSSFYANMSADGVEKFKIETELNTDGTFYEGTIYDQPLTVDRKYVVDDLTY